MKDFSNVIIIAGGNVEADFLKEQLEILGYSFIIGADKGIEVLQKIGTDPNLILGDFDSADCDTLDDFRRKKIEIIELNPIKDDTDMEFAIRESIRRFPGKPIKIFGATGTRLDHTVANMELLHIGYEDSLVTKIELLDSHNRIKLLSPGKFSIVRKEQFGGFISLICYTDEVKGLTLEGLKYGLTDKNIKKGTSLCISNEIVDEKAAISFDEGMVFLIEARD